jgi:hypothetical protein
MIKLISKPWEWLTWLWGLGFPMFSDSAAGDEKAFPAARWAGRTVFGLIILLILGAINQASGLKNWIPYPPLIGKIWLPLFGLCLYMLLWLGWWLYRILSLDIGAEPSEFPDIDRAWAQAMEALARADIRLDSTPLFLVLGWSSGTEESFFQAGGIKAKVNQVPRDKAEPLHVTADRDSVWLTCPGVSLLNQHNPAIVGQDDASEHLGTMAEESADPYKTIGIGQGAGLGLQDLLSSAKKGILDERGAVKGRQVFDRERYAARLRHLCRLIKRDRLGFCPINGVLVLLPVSAVDPKSGPEEIAAACRSDLTEAFGVMRMRCPVLVMVTGLERLEGFAELIARLPAGQSGKRMGQRFPLIADLSENELPLKIESSVDWIVNNLFGSMIYSMFQVESNRGVDEVAEILRGNQQLFRFLVRIRERRDRLTRLVRECIPHLGGERLMFGGCYFAGTGEEPDTEQAFASGVLMRLIQDQDSVCWTEAAVREDVKLQRTARSMRMVLGLLIAALILAILGLVGARLLHGSPSTPQDTSGRAG